MLAGAVLGERNTGFHLGRGSRIWLWAPFKMPRSVAVARPGRVDSGFGWHRGTRMAITTLSRHEQNRLPGAKTWRCWSPAVWRSCATDSAGSGRDCHEDWAKPVKLAATGFEMMPIASGLQF
jgi:hypothetical protein